MQRLGAEDCEAHREAPRAEASARAHVQHVAHRAHGAEVGLVGDEAEDGGQDEAPGGHVVHGDELEILHLEPPRRRWAATLVWSAAEPRWSRPAPPAPSPGAAGSAPLRTGRGRTAAVESRQSADEAEYVQSDTDLPAGVSIHGHQASRRDARGGYARLPMMRYSFRRRHILPGCGGLVAPFPRLIDGSIRT